MAFHPRLSAGLAFGVTDVLARTVLVWNTIVTLQCYTEDLYDKTYVRIWTPPVKQAVPRLQS